MKLISKGPLGFTALNEPRMCEWREGIMRCSLAAVIRYVTDEDVKELCRHHSLKYEERYLSNREEAP